MLKVFKGCLMHLNFNLTFFTIEENKTITIVLYFVRTFLFLNGFIFCVNLLLMVNMSK